MVVRQLLFVVFAVFVAFVWREYSKPTATYDKKPKFTIDQPDKWLRTHYTNNKIPTIDWPDVSKPFAAEIVAGGRPVVLNAKQILTDWRASSVWNREYLLETLGPDFTLRRVFWGGNQTVFLFQNDSEVAQYPGTVRWYEEINMPLKAMLDRLSQPEKYGYFYFSTPVSILGAKMLADVQPSTIMSPLSKADTKLQHLQIWIGSVGVTTQMHYDLDYNFHLQITGQKRFLLLPPNLHKYIHLFPRPHQHHRRSQVVWSGQASNIDADLVDRLLKEPDVMEITLQKGETLYIPPFWFHHVTNLDAGISVNVWTDTDTKKQNILKMWSLMPGLPANYTDNQPATLAFFKTFIFEVLKNSLTNNDNESEVDEKQKQKSVLSWIKHHWEQRYERLTQKGHALASLGPQELCNQPVDKLLVPILDKAIMFASAAAQGVKESHPEGFEIILGDFVDGTALIAMSKQHRAMGAFLKTCFLD